MSHKGCKLCEITHKVFGDKYPSCAAISNEMVTEALDMMKAKTKHLQEIADVKFKRGEITPEEHSLAFDNAKFSMAFAAATLVSVMIIDGPTVSPKNMIELVEGNIIQTLTNLGISVEQVPARHAVPDSRMN